MTLPPQPRVVRSVDVVVDVLDDGRLRFRSPRAVGFAACARTPMELNAALARTMAEDRRAAEAQAARVRYDLERLTERKDRLR